MSGTLEIPVQIKGTYTAGKVPSSSDLIERQLYVNLPDGKLYTLDNEGNTVTLGVTLGELAAVALSGKFSDLAQIPTTFTPPIATSTTVGGVMPQAGLSIDEEGHLSINIATSSTTGTVKPGTGLALAVDGTLSVTGPSAGVASITVGTGSPQTGAATVTAAQLGLATVASSGSYSDLSNVPAPNILINAQSGVTYTPVASDRAKCVSMNSGTAATLSLPVPTGATGNFPNGWYCELRSGGQQLTLVVTAGGHLDGVLNGTLLIPALGSINVVTDGTNWFTLRGTPIVSGGILTNPMTAPGDVITGGVGGTPGRLAIGTNGQVLSVSSVGTPTWTTPLAPATAQQAAAGASTAVAMTPGVMSAFLTPYGLAAATTAVSTDLNLVVTGGTFFVSDNTTLNSPGSDNYGYGFQLSSGSDYGVQVFVNSQGTKIYSRILSGGAWTGWSILSSTTTAYNNFGNSETGGADTWFDLTVAATGSITVIGDTNFNIANWPSTGYAEFILEVINGGAFTVGWHADDGHTTNWIKSDGTTTTDFSASGITLQAAGSTWLKMWTHDGGTTQFGIQVRS